MIREENSSKILLYFLSLAVLTMLTMSPLLLIISYFGAILCNFLLFGAKNAVKSVAFSMIVVLVAGVFNPVFVHGGVTPLFFLNGRAYTLESMIYGFCAGGMLTSVFLWFKCFSLLFTFDKFIYVFGTRIPRFSLDFSMSLGLIPRIFRIFKQVDMAQKGMGMYSNRGFIERIYVKLKVFSAVLGHALEGSMDMADSMEARGFGLGVRTLYRFKTGGVRHIFDMIFIGCFAIFSLIFMILSNEIVFYPRLKLVNFGIFELLSAVSLCILSLYFSVNFCVRRVKWLCLKSKI